jgi:hypothetical protein
LFVKGRAHVIALAGTRAILIVLNCICDGLVL